MTFIYIHHSLEKYLPLLRLSDVLPIFYHHQIYISIPKTENSISLHLKPNRTKNPKVDMKKTTTNNPIYRNVSIIIFFSNNWLFILCLFDNYFHDLFLISFLSLPPDFHWSLYDIISHVYLVEFDALYVNINWNLYFWCQAFANQSLT